MSARARKKVFVAMSGGVDSSVAALLLAREGDEVLGAFMRCVNVDGCAERDAEDARRVAARLGIPFYVWDFEDEYRRRVVDYMVEGYRAGVTPNPDVMCNREIKFGLFLKRALELGADYVATGHYVRIRKNAGSYALFTAKDASKDQSYFLWTLTQEQLRHCLFPIGNHVKSEVRAMARWAGLPTAEKKDSQGICFLGKVALAEFLRQYIPEKRGAVLTTAGEEIGKHPGAAFYTIGQRHGLGIAGRLPYYVAEKNVDTNTLVVAEGRDHTALYRKEVELTDVNFIRSLPSLIRANRRIRNKEIRVLARMRYRQPLASAYLFVDGDGKAELHFDAPQKFIAAGQSAVFYSDERRDLPAGRQVLGGGVIRQ